MNYFYFENNDFLLIDEVSQLPSFLHSMNFHVMNWSKL